MSALKNITGQRFGRLVVIGRVRSEKNRKTYWKCLCDCGNISTVRGSHLSSGNIQSCGCFRKMKLSQERKDKISKAAKKRWSDPSFKASMSGDGCSLETREKHSESMKHRWEDNTYRREMSKMAKASWRNDEYRESQIKRLSGFRHSVESRRKIGDRHRGKVISEESRLLISLAKKGKRCSPGTEFTSKMLKKRYQDPEYVKKMAKAWNIKPNKPETLILNLLNNLYPGEWKYTGDFSFTINGKCPDFVNCNGQKKCIEFNGTYWHQNDIPGEREKIFAEFGYDTLIIWDTEMNDMDSVIKKIKVFSEAA